MAQRVEVCQIAELQPGERKIVEVDGLPHSIGVFNIDNEYFAIANMCPHHLAPLCEGELAGDMTSEGVGDFDLTREGEIIQCPWHGWKFDIKDGVSVFNPHNVRTRTYEAVVETGCDMQSGEGSRVDEEGQIDEGEGETDEENEFGTALRGDEPPIDTYDVEVEQKVVVLKI